jgi:hypothetical protein
MDAPASVEGSFHINKILDYLPVIIISVIFLVGFFTWDVVRNEMASFMMLILVFIYALWIMKGDAKSYKSWLDTPADKYILPKIGNNGDPFQDKGIWLGLAIFIFVVLGLGLGFGSIGISKIADNTPTTVKTLNIFGGIFSIGGIVLVIYSLWKIFRDDGSVVDATADTESDKSNTKRAGLGGFIGSVLGFYMIARAKIIENDGNEVVNDKAKADYKANPVNNGASAALVSGLVLQVIGYALVFAVLYFKNKFTEDFTFGGLAVKAILIIGFILCGILWIGTSQGWPGLKIGDGSVGDFNSNVFAAHGGIYIIFAVIFLVSTLGKLEKSRTYYSFGWVLVVLFAGCYIWNWVVMSKQNTKEQITSEQTNILREEVAKELKNKAPVGTDVTDEQVNAAVIERIQTKQKPSEIVNGVFSSLSVVIILIITIFHNMRLRLGICGKFPVESDNFVAGLVSWGKNLFRSLMPPTDPTVTDGYCADLNGDILPATKNTKAYAKVEKGEIDNVTGTEWDSLLNTYKDGESTNINKLIVRTAKGAMWNPFLLMIILIMWVAIVFTRVSTSEATNVWIAKSFTGDMFPKVKELIDTFFIVLIIGLLLCGLLLLPMVKELNVGGLGSMLNFAESIQVWQYDHNGIKSPIVPIIFTLIMSGAILGAGLGTLFTYDLVPKETKWIVSILIVLIALCFSPVWYSITTSPDTAFKNESIIIRIVRLFFTGVYLIPWFIFTIFKLVLFGIPGFFNKEMRDKRDEELAKLAFWNWKPDITDLRIFAIGEQPTPESVTSMAVPDYSETAQAKIRADSDEGAKAAMEQAIKTTPGTETPDQAKVGAIGKLIKAILLTVSFVIMILAAIYMVYKVGAGNRSAEQDAASGGIAAQLNSPTAQVIYVIMAIVAVAGFVAYIREKFTKANSKTPEDYLFDDYKPEDTTKPMRQLTFSMTHVIYVVLMIIVWVYDTDIDDKNRMSITGMTVLGVAILFFHYFLEFIDNKEPAAATATASGEPKMASISKLFTNIRFIVNSIFLIVLCVLAFYKQHSVMVVLIVFMFLFHITKSILGMKFLRLIWLCVIYIPCLFLGLLTKSQGAVGDTTRPIWIILAIELILVLILYGGPYLLNYIGASNSQIIAAPVPLQPKNDTGLTTQSPQIFIFHNTALNRSDSDKAANCAPEEKKRYNYSVTGWFWINNNVNTIDKDLEIFNFGGVPKLTYNPGTTEFKVSCKTVSLTTGMSNANYTVVYNSRFNYHNTKELSDTQKTKFDILNDSHTTDTQIPIQKWNYFVINYDGKSMDVFLNNTLVAKSEFLIPDITMMPITSGDDGNGTPDKPEGLSGNVCNIAFHKEPMTLEQIRWTYTMMKSHEPPMIGMKTIADEVKTTGSTNIYS